MIGKYVIIRSFHAGVHAGILKSMEKDSVILTNSRRVWFWSGAAALSQLAMEGMKNPDLSKIEMPLPEIQVNGVIEIIPCSAMAEKIITECPIWKN